MTEVLDENRRSEKQVLIGRRGVQKTAGLRGDEKLGTDGKIPLSNGAW